MPHWASLSPAVFDYDVAPEESRGMWRNAVGIQESFQNVRALTLSGQERESDLNTFDFMDKILNTLEVLAHA